MTRRIDRRFPHRAPGQASPPRRARALTRLSAALLAFLCGFGPRLAAQDPNGPPAPPTAPAPASAPAPVAAAPEPPPDPNYQVKTDFSNVKNADAFEVAVRLPARLRPVLARQAFAIDRGTEKEFYPLYLGERYPFITADSLFHAYYLLFSEAFRRIEERRLLPRLEEFTSALFKGCARQAEQDADFDRLAAFAAVAGRLLRPECAVPERVAAVVERELALIRAARGPAASPLWGRDLDYGDFRVRGDYARTERAARYFRCLTWYHRVLFRLESDEETREALALAALVADDPACVAACAEIDEWTTYFAGPADDPDVRTYAALARELFGAPTPLGEAARDPARLAAFRERARRLPAPSVCGDPPLPMEGAGFRERTRGMRCFPEHATPTARLFQALQAAGRGLPSGLDVAATLLGSRRAAEHLAAAGLRSAGASGFAGVADRLRADAPPDAALDHPTVVLRILAPLLTTPGPRHPAFLRGASWQDKTINTVLGAWVEAEHAVQLHTKDARISMGSGDGFDRFRGYAEPFPEFYNRLAAAAESLRARLCELRFFAPGPTQDGAPGPAVEREIAESEGVPSELTETHFVRLAELGRRLAAIARKELDGGALDYAESRLFDTYGDTLKWLAFNTSNSVEHPEDPAKVVDLATEYQSGRCREAAIGRVFPLYVVVPSEYGLMLCRGGSYSYYELDAPLSGRMTDEEWRARLGDPAAAPAPWIEGKEVGVEPLAALAITPEEVAAVKAYCAAGHTTDYAAQWRFNELLSSMAARPARTDALPGLLELAGEPCRDPRIRPLAAAKLIGWDDPRAMEFFRAALTWRPTALPKEKRYSGTDACWEEELELNPLFGVAVSDLNLLAPLITGYCRRATAGDREALTGLWTRYSPQEHLDFRDDHRLDPLLDPIADALLRLDATAASARFAADFRTDERRVAAFRQLYRLAPETALDDLTACAATGNERARRDATVLLADPACTGGTARLLALANAGGLPVRYAAANRLFGGILADRVPELDDLLFAQHRYTGWGFGTGAPEDQERMAHGRTILPTLLRQRRPEGLSRPYACALLGAAELGLDEIAGEVAATVTEEAAARRFGVVFRAGASALGVLGGEESRAALRRAWTALAQEPPGTLLDHRLVVAASLVLQDMPEAEAAIPPLLAAPGIDEMDRREFCRRLPAVGTRQANLLLVRLITDPAIAVDLKETLAAAGLQAPAPELNRVCAAWAVAQPRSPRGGFDPWMYVAPTAAPVLLECLDREPGGASAPSLRRSVAQLDHPAVLERLRSWLRSSAAEIRRLAIQGLGYQRSARAAATALLLTVVDGPERDDALEAAFALTRLGPTGEAALATRLRTGAGWPRAVAFYALRRLHASDAPRYLEAVFADPDPGAQVIAALVEFAGVSPRITARSVAPLEAALAGADPTLARFVAEQVAYFGPGEEASAGAGGSAKPAADPAATELRARVLRLLSAARAAAAEAAAKERAGRRDADDDDEEDE
ncbi:MAG: DUF3160 domain-containing protein [Planctomycetes bacterium]|nr:DUF3160 domain-containing protein [Planctomycetota bacterium]